MHWFTKMDFGDACNLFYPWFPIWGEQMFCKCLPRKSVLLKRNTFDNSIKIPPVFTYLFHVTVVTFDLHKATSDSMMPHTDR